jgi:ubiquinone/menaquinone biosynthesis C-methylase UbiE
MQRRTTFTACRCSPLRTDGSRTKAIEIFRRSTLTTAVANVEMHALKHRLRATWMAGDYDRFSRFMESSAVEFLERVAISPGASLLDVACGSGQLALVAARRGVQVTGVDIAENSIRAARERAQAEALPAQFDQRDAEALPYADASFDAVASLLGAMFARRPDLVAHELVRLCRRGGTIAMANWTKTGFIGHMFAVVSRFVAPPGTRRPCYGAMSRQCASGLVRRSPLRLTRVMYRFDYPFSPVAASISFASTTDRPIAHSPRSLDPIKRRCTPISWRSGVRRIRAATRAGP